MTDPSDSTFVPVPRTALSSLLPAVREAENAARTQELALARLLELADDLRADAVQRLRERRASEAQVERYQEAFEKQRAATRAAVLTLESALRGLRSAAQLVVGEESS